MVRDWHGGRESCRRGWWLRPGSGREDGEKGKELRDAEKEEPTGMGAGLDEGVRSGRVGTGDTQALPVRWNHRRNGVGD